MQERACGDTTGIPCGAGEVAIAIDNVVAGISRMRRVVDAELGVIQKVEGLEAKLERASFRQGEAFCKADVEVDAVRVAEEIATRVSKGETGWSGEPTRIADERAKGSTSVNSAVGRGHRRSCQVRIRGGADDGHDASVIGCADAVDGTGIEDAEGGAGLKN